MVLSHQHSNHPSGSHPNHRTLQHHSTWSLQEVVNPTALASMSQLRSHQIQVCLTVRSPFCSCWHPLRCSCPEDHFPLNSCKLSWNNPHISSNFPSNLHLFSIFPNISQHFPIDSQHLSAKFSTMFADVSPYIMGWLGHPGAARWGTSFSSVGICSPCGRCGEEEEMGCRCIFLQMWQIYE